MHALSAVALIALTGLVWHLAQPTWVELPDSFAEIRHTPASLVITLEGGHYVQPELCMKPLVGPVPGNTNLMRRLPVYIQGSGTLKCPNITCCEVHLAPGVTFMTSGRFKTDSSTFIKDSVPPPDAEWNNHIGYPTYVVEPGAKLVFTENDAYPSALIRR